ncbi:MAG: hypothetical protein MHM6MM_001907 [Cercozoa sp. M6MM]
MRTTLTQESVATAADALERFNDEARNGRLPLVLIPEERNCCSCMLTVPSGVHAILHKWGADANAGVEGGELAPAGLHCLPAYYKVAYVVSQQSCTYNAPVKACPTKDNVMIDCDLALVFRIGPTPADVKKFVYTLGASRFNEFLSSATEEGIRQLVRETPHQQAYELRGGNLVRHMIDELNKKFSKFGVTFTSAVITDVRLPGDLAHTLQATTEFDSKIKDSEKEHEHNVKVIDFDSAQKIEEQQKDFDLKILKVEARRDRALVDREKLATDARGRLDVAVTQAQETAAVQEKNALSEKHVVKLTGQKEGAEKTAAAGARAERIKISADKDAEARIQESEMRVKAAEDRARALRTEADAEKLGSQSLRAIREHKLAMARAEVLEILSRSQRIVISGDQGDKLINSILDSGILNGTDTVGF